MFLGSRNLVRGRSAARVGSFIADGGSAPLRMDAFIAVKALQADGVAHHPASAGSQVHISAAHKAYKFDTIPNIGIGHADLDHRHGRGDIDDRGRDRYRAASGQRPDDCGQTNISAVFQYHAEKVAGGRCERYGVLP
jgi:hypothetical protein